jgi:hypothetical protein
MESPADRNRMDGRRLRRPRKRSIMDGVRLRGRVGKAVAPYADGADILARESRRYLKEFLRFSAVNLDLETPRRGSRVRSKPHRGLERSR